MVTQPVTTAQQRARPDVTMVVPMYNEEETILQHISELVDALEGLRLAWELVLINDGSTDSTAAKLLSCQEAEPRIRVVSYRKNRGRGYALRRGFELAQGEIIVTTEADLSYGTPIIGEMLEVVEREDVDIAVASPYVRGGCVQGVPWLRALLSRYGNRMLSLALGRRTATVSGMTRAYRRAVLEVLDLESDGKEIHLEILSKAFALGFRASDVPATLRWDAHRRRTRARAHTFKLMGFMLSHLLFSFTELPFLLIGTVSMVLLAIAGVAGLHLFQLSAQGVPVGGRPLTLAVVMCVLSGIQLLMFSFLAHQMRDLNRQVVRLQGRINDWRKKSAGPTFEQDDLYVSKPA